MLSEEMRRTSRDIGLLVLRVVVAGTMLLGHGYPKLVKLTNGGGFADPFGVGENVSLALATGAEFFCAALVIVGLATRLAAIPLVITMATAVFVFHAGDPFGDKELPLIYGTAFLTLVLTGPGRLSVDAVIGFFWRE